MKRVLFAALLLCISTAAANADNEMVKAPADPALESFLAGLATPSLEPPAAPEAISAAACHVSKECVCGGGYVTIECSGEVSCQVRVRSVVCDGIPTDCPPIGSCPP
jgi:hypothetical protein